MPCWNGGPIGQREVGYTFTEEFHELADHLGLAQHFRHGQHQVGGRDPASHCAGQVHAHHVRGQKINRLSEHAGLGFDAANAPADHADTVDHGGMAVGSDQRVGVVDAVLLVHAACQVLEVDLVHDANAGRHDLESVKGLHPPLHELVALVIALEFQLHVQI